MEDLFEIVRDLNLFLLSYKSIEAALSKEIYCKPHM